MGSFSLVGGTVGSSSHDPLALGINAISLLQEGHITQFMFREFTSLFSV